ncbi:Biopolymer transport protein ExbB [invertebrate metagenome]|uniref:Biopolymer transport protein ExbB n=1 Tax=invertebrate metagenome TaxID=1711999 RepID=A0A2H9T7N4_9ZZZZ
MLTDQIASLGTMTWPLLTVSCLGLALILERLMTYSTLPSLGKKSLRALYQEIKYCAHCNNNKKQLCKHLSNKHGLHQGLAILLSHNTCNKGVREEVAGLWLLKQKQFLHARLKLLMLIGVLSPMLGLLGTVLGLINMFQGIAGTAGPVTPDVLAEGLWEAMYTTAFGLMIAIPTLAAAHGLGIWADYYMGRLEFAMNHANLLLEGLAMNDDGMAEDNEANPPCHEVTKAKKSDEAVLA